MRTEDQSPRRRWEERFCMPDWSLSDLVFDNPISLRATMGLADVDEVWQCVAERLNLKPDDLSELKTKLLKQRKPRIFNSHDYFDPRFKKVIYLIRDPRDILASLYPFYISIGIISKNYSKSKFLKEYFKGKFNANFGSWNENVGSWIGANNEKTVMIIKYEDLKRNIFVEAKKIFKFFKIKKTRKQINIAIKKSGVFRGEVGIWKKFFSNKQASEIKKNWKTNMKRLGYY